MPPSEPSCDAQPIGQHEFAKRRGRLASLLPLPFGVTAMQPVVGTASIVEQPDTVAPAAPPYTYLGVAEGLMPGVAALACSPSPSALASALLCAHVLECLLKAYLSKVRGTDAALKGKGIRHNLTGLWSLAVSEGLAVSLAAPAWVQQLSHLHNAPYYLRYSTGVHGIVLPALEPMTSELSALLGTVRAKVI